MVATSNEVSHVCLPFDDVRLKLTRRCNWTCTFCHQEGNGRTDDFVWTAEFEDLLHRLRETLCIGVVHLTGGEPSLHPNICGVVANLHAEGFEVRLTSNGTLLTSILPSLKHSGLRRLNVSLPTTDPHHFASMHAHLPEEEWAVRQISEVKRALETAKSLDLAVRINCTVSRLPTRFLDLIAFARDLRVPIAFQDDLFSEDAIPALESIVATTDAKLIQVRRRAIGSQLTYVFQMSDGYRYFVKATRSATLASVCGDCSLRGSCKEHFYCLRVEQVNKRTFVRLCLHRQDPGAVMPASDFPLSAAFRDIRDLLDGACDMHHAVLGDSSYAPMLREAVYAHF